MEVTNKKIGSAYKALRQLSPNAIPDAESVKAIRAMLPKSSKKTVESSVRLLVKIAHQSTKAQFVAFVSNGEVPAITLDNKEMDLAKAGNGFFHIFVHWIIEGTTLEAPGLPWIDDSIGFCY
ncbi:MAG: hypothetical protein ABL958_09925 [Bdellovibrionia bacterium]